MAKFVVCSMALAAAFALSSCGIGSSLGPASLEDQQARAQAATTTPRLQAGEKIRITVFGEASLSGDYEIDQSGFVSLPLAGTIKAAGFTQPELEQELAKKFRSEYLRNPKVTVTLVSLRPFYIVGEVEKPGEYPYKSGLNVLTAAGISPFFLGDDPAWRPHPGPGAVFLGTCPGLGQLHVAQKQHIGPIAPRRPDFSGKSPAWQLFPVQIIG
jgi:polysaccharide export outer membrane protein